MIYFPLFLNNSLEICQSSKENDKLRNSLIFIDNFFFEKKTLSIIHHNANSLSTCNIICNVVIDFAGALTEGIKYYVAFNLETLFKVRFF